MKIKGFKEFSDKDLLEKLNDERQTLNSMKFQHSIAGLESPVQIKAVRKNIARLLTEINGRKTK